MKTFLSMIFMALSLSACAVDKEQDKLCHYLHTCDTQGSMYE